MLVYSIFDLYSNRYLFGIKCYLMLVLRLGSPVKRFIVTKHILLNTLP